MKSATRKLADRKGQTAVEYLMLLGATFIAAYFMVTGPIASFTTGLINNLRFGIGNVVRNAEWTNEVIAPGDARSPSSPERLRPIHLQ